MNPYPFPKLQITEYEKQFVGHYASGKKPGVMKRVYRADLISYDTAAPPSWASTTYPSPIFAAQVQISRRAKVCALIFIGDVSQWYLDIKTASGDTFTPAVPGNTTNATTPPGCLVSSMIPGALYDSQSAMGSPGVGANPVPMTSGVCDIDPAWELSPNQTLIFTGSLAPGVVVAPGAAAFLSIGVHVWEYPGMSGR